MVIRPLPADFLLGCATAAYQVEGGIHNDWSAWAQVGRLKDQTVRCGRATDHWHRFEEDFDRLVDIGADAYRMSIEWARVEPEPGRFDADAIAHYQRMIRALRSRGIRPFVTLLHFTHPPWFHDTCPWDGAEGEASGRFERFTRKLLEALEGEVQDFTILNEPGVWLSAAYFAGVIPPGRPGLRRLGRAGAELIRAHARAAGVIREAVPGAQIGVAHNVLRFAPARVWHPSDRAAAAYLAQAFNHAIPRALTTGHWQLGLLPGVRLVAEIPEAKGSLDFLGINYYSRVFARVRWPRTPALQLFYEDRGGLGVSDLGWEVHPSGLTDSLLEMGRYGLPLYVTENGIDDRSDTRRAAYLHDHLGAVLDAHDRGADVRGYFHWSLLDNFEWLEGFEPRFGLYRVDYDTFERHPTTGSKLFGRIATARGLSATRPDEVPRRGVGRVPVG